MQMIGVQGRTRPIREILDATTVSFSALVPKAEF